MKHLGVKPEVSPNSKTSTSSHTWRRSILWFFGGAFSTILLLVIAYFGIRMGNTSGQLPERQVAARFAADLKQVADENRSDIEQHVRTLYARQSIACSVTQSQTG